MMFQRILVYADTARGTHPVTGHVRTLARACGATVKLVDISPEPSIFARFSKISPADIQRAITAEKRTALETLARTLQRSKLSVDVEVLTGDSQIIALLDAIERGKHDLIMKSAESAPSRDSSGVGSIGRRLMRKATCPVYVAHERNSRARLNVMVAIDPGEGASPNPLAIKLLETTRELAGTLKARAHVVNAWWAPGESLLNRHLGPAGIQEYVEAARDDFQERADDAIRQVGGLDAELHLVKGDPGDVLPRLVAKHKIDLVVLGSVARSGVPGLLLGNTAEKLIGRLPCSMLVVKPDGFVSPLKRPR